MTYYSSVCQPSSFSLISFSYLTIISCILLLVSSSLLWFSFIMSSISSLNLFLSDCYWRSLISLEMSSFSLLIITLSLSLSKSLFSRSIIILLAVSFLLLELVSSLSILSRSFFSYPSNELRFFSKILMISLILSVLSWSCIFPDLD